MRKEARLIFVVFFVLALAVIPSAVSAGTWLLGGKIWYVNWEQFYGQWDDTVLSAYGDGSTSIASSNVEPSKGVMAGPVVGYQTDNKQWTLSTAFMYGYFKTQIVVDQVLNPPVAPADNKILIPIDQYILGLTRYEFDFALSRSLGSMFKVFVGYKWQHYEPTLTIPVWVTVNGTPVYTIIDYTYTANVHMPTAGLAFAYPITDIIAVGAQIGVLYVIPTGKFTTDSFPNNPVVTDTPTTLDLKMKNTFGLNTEVNISFLMFQSVILQVGGRYQHITMKPEENEITGKLPTATDKFYGISIGAVYLL